VRVTSPTDLEDAGTPDRDRVRSALQAATNQVRRRRAAIRLSLLALLVGAPVVVFVIGSVH
jgi:hypothetical protein